MNTISKFLEGKKTFIGIAVVIIGFFGGAKLISEAETAQTIDSILQLIGIGITIYGRYKARPKTI